MKSETASGQSLFSLLQQRIAEMKDRAAAIQEQLDIVKADLSAYEQALAVEKRRSGLTDDHASDKWLLFEQFCTNRIEQGFTRPEITRFYQERGVPVGKNF